MTGEFQWVPWSEREVNFVKNPVTLGVSQVYIAFIARVVKPEGGKHNNDGGGGGVTDQLFGFVMRHSEPRRAEIIGQNGILEHEADYEVMVNYFNLLSKASAL